MNNPVTLHASFVDLLQGLGIAGLAGFGLLAALLAEPSAGPVAAMFPPWWDATRSVSAAAQGGSVLRFGAVDFIVLVDPGDPNGRRRLRRAGAWLLLNPHGVAGCVIGTNF
jgi:hypothetical protein